MLRHFPPWLRVRLGGGRGQHRGPSEPGNGSNLFEPGNREGLPMYQLSHRSGLGRQLLLEVGGLWVVMEMTYFIYYCWKLVG
jgi:hypothetical protein